MAEFPNNQNTSDTNDEHTLRVNMCVAGMTAHPEVAFRGTLVVDMTAHRDTWESLDSQHANEWGDEQAATAFTKKCEDELDEKLTAARFMVESMLAEEEVIGVTEFDIRRDFGVEVSKPRTRAGMLALGKKMVETNARYVTELSPYALPAPFFADLALKVTALQTAIDTHAKELDERLSVGEAVRLERSKGDRLLKQAFDWLCALLGADDFLLLEFGFVPSSQIYTPGVPVPGQANYPDKVENMKAEKVTPPSSGILISSNTLNGAYGYKIRHAKAKVGDPRPEKPPTDWMTGEIPSFLDPDVQVGYVYYYWMCGTDENGIEGAWSDASMEWVG
jgi:hypothetical protein